MLIIEDLNQVIGNREVIPTSEVYDRFTNVCESYMNLQAENSYLLSVNSIVKTLSSIGNMVRPSASEPGDFSQILLHCST